MKLTKHKKILFLLVALFIFYAITNSAYSIYREIKEDSIDLNILDPNGMVAVSFNANGGSINPQESSRSVQRGTAVGQLPVVTRADHNFAGWYTHPTEGTEINENTIVNGLTVTYYAHWNKIVCKKALTGTLHTETCSAGGGCLSSGYSLNDTITYGTIPGVSSPITGDAYDCDVNNDGIWDDETERFYYVRGFNDNNNVHNSVLIHFTSFDESGQMDDSDVRLIYGYTAGQAFLPDSTLWSNPSLTNFNGRVSRYIKQEDLEAACGTWTTAANYLDSCQFYMENTRFQSSSLGRSGLWLEQIGGHNYRIDSRESKVVSVKDDSNNAVRPNIQIPSNTIEGYMQTQKYSVNLYSEGGNPSEYSFERYENQILSTLPEPTKSGYEFDGWYTDNINFTTQLSANTVVTGNIVGYAKWIPVDPLEYVFYIPGECTFSSSGLANGSNGDCISTINPTGSNIDYTDSTLSAKKYIDTGVELYNSTNIGKDYEIGFTIVSYNSGDNENRATIIGSKSEINSSTLKYPGIVFRRDDATTNFLLQSRETLAANAQETFASASVQDVVIYRTGEAIYYSINGGAKTKLHDIGQFNPTFDLPVWIGANYGNVAATTVQRYFTGTLSNIYIKLEREENNKVTITYDPNYPNEATFDIEYTKNEAIGSLPTYTRTGYTLLGWFTDPNNGTQITTSTIASADTIYYAHWAENITITFDANGGNVEPTTRTIPPGSAIGSLPTPTRTGYTFLGWFSDNTEQATEITPQTTFQTTTSIVAKWVQNITITFNANGGNVDPTSRSIAPGSAIGSLPTPTRTGYGFLGWFSDNTEQATEITSSTTFLTSTSIIAKWEEYITITFNANGGSVDPTSRSIAPGSAIGNLPTPTRAGYNFLGWFSDDTEQAIEITSLTTFQTTTSIIAKWERIPDYIITYDAKGGTVTPSQKSVTPNTAAGELAIPEKPDNLFVGWFTDDENYTTEVTEETIITGNIIVYAKWVDESYVACIGSQCYTTLSAAIANVPTNNAKTTVKLLQDVSLSAKITIESTKNIEFDLQTYTITSSTIVFENSGTLHINNGTIISTTTDTTNGRAIINKSGGIINITGGFLNATKTNVMENKGTVNITGGRLEANGQSAVINNENGGVLNISAGEIVGTSTTKCQAVYNNGGTLTISGTAYLENNSNTDTSNSSTGGRACVHNNAGTTNILGGTIISKQNIGVKNNATMNIGTDDQTIDTTNPVIQGKIYGLEAIAGKTTNVYDGIFKGNSIPNNKAINNENNINIGTYTVTHTTETIGVDTYDVAYLTNQALSYTVTFNTNSGTMSDPATRTFNSVSAIGSLPTPTKTDSEFLGWFTAATGGELILPTREINSDIQIYAHYTNARIVCRPATTLHTSGNTTFGQIPSSQSLSGGDAFDCDVNGDGTYDAATERFYYLTNTNDGKAVLIFYNNTSQVNNAATPICNATAVAYAPTFTEGPNTAKGELPTTAQWKNVSLYTQPRTIKNEQGTTVASDYVYTEKAARFATLDEIKAATTSGLNETAYELTNYAYLLENTASYGDCRSNYWLETTNSNSGANRINGAANAQSLGHAAGSSGVRPVIEVPYSSIENATQIVEFDTIPPAMRVYFNNVSTWNSGQNDLSYNSFNNAMTTNLNNYNCVYYQNDNTGTEYGTEYCDQPNKYDTHTTGTIYVYEHNETTGVDIAANYVFNDNGKLYNFIPGKVYYWESASDSSINGYVKPTGERRIISIPGANRKTRNVRDLGGLPVDTDGNGTIDGTIKYQKLYRGEKIWGSNRNGITRAQFEKLGIYNEYDLRTQGSEIVISEEDQLANYTPFEIVHYKIDHTEFGSPATEPQFNGKSYYQLARDSAIDIMQKIVAENDDYSIYFHCRIGADRTGTLAYILEGLLGVPTEYRHQDYELTTFFGLRERTRYYYNKGTNNYKFLYLKKAIRHATPNNNEDTGEENVMDWFLLEGNSTPACNDISALITQFRSKMIDYN